MAKMNLLSDLRQESRKETQLGGKIVLKPGHEARTNHAPNIAICIPSGNGGYIGFLLTTWLAGERERKRERFIQPFANSSGVQISSHFPTSHVPLCVIETWNGSSKLLEIYFENNATGSPMKVRTSRVGKQQAVGELQTRKRGKMSNVSHEKSDGHF